MSLNTVQLCEDYNIPYRTKGKNCAPGWTQICCPHCFNDTGFHGGINDTGYYNCWKCGHSFLDQVLQNVIGISKREAKQIIKIYSGKSVEKVKTKKRKVTFLELPKGTGPLEKIHKKYLISRNFDPDKLERIYGLKATGHSGPYKFRIVAPIYLDGNLVSYQCRDVTNKALLRYKACQKSNEIMHHKHTLYAIDNVPHNKVIVVEGIADVWRMGPGSVCPFGTSWTQEQMNMIAKRFKAAAILFDPEEQAQLRAERLSWNLSALGVKVEIITGLTTDPGDLKQEDANRIMKELL